MENPEGFTATLTHNRTIACLSNHKWLQQHRYYVLILSVNGVSTTFILALWKMQVLCGEIKP